MLETRRWCVSTVFRPPPIHFFASSIAEKVLSLQVALYSIRIVILLKILIGIFMIFNNL